MSSAIVPAHDALSAMPGDTIKFNDGLTTCYEVVMRAGWQPTPKGGKVWTYELMSGELVPNQNVIEVLRQEKNSVESKPVAVADFQKLREVIDESELPVFIRSAMQCLLTDDEADLEVAMFLIQKRLSLLKSNKPTVVG